MKKDGKYAHAADAGEKVWIKLPDSRKFIEVGDRIYKTRSASLKSRVEHLLAPPKEYKLKPWKMISASFDLLKRDNKLVLQSTWFRQNRKILEKEYVFELIESQKEAVLEAGLRTVSYTHLTLPTKA